MDKIKLDSIQPNKEKKEFEILMKEIEFDSEGQNISGKIFYPPVLKEKNPAVLFIHGWKGDQSGRAVYAKAIAEYGFIAMTFNLRGHGNSEGDRDTLYMDNFLNDVLSAFDILTKDEKVDKDNITVVGNSFGSYLTARILANRKIKDIVLQAPANYPDDVLDKKVSEFTGSEDIDNWRKKKTLYFETQSLQSIHDFQGRVCIIESEFDEAIPHQTTMNYINAVNNTNELVHCVLKNAPHRLNNPKLRAEYQDMLVQFLKHK